MTTRSMARQALSEHSLRQPLSLWLCRRPPSPFVEVPAPYSRQCTERVPGVIPEGDDHRRST